MDKEKDKPIDVILRSLALAESALSQPALHQEFDEVLGLELLNISKRNLHDMDFSECIDYLNRSLLGRFFRTYAPLVMEYGLEKALYIIKLQGGEENERPVSEVDKAEGQPEA